MTEGMFGRICLIQFTVLSEASSKERSVFDHKVCVEVDGMACLSDRLFSSREDDWTRVTEGWFYLRCLGFKWCYSSRWLLGSALVPDVVSGHVDIFGIVVHSSKVFGSGCEGWLSLQT